MNFNIKNILPGAILVMGLGLSSCVGDLDVTPIDPSTNMVVDPVALYTKCYANMALAGQGGANGDCDIDGLDGGTTGYVRQLFNANELTTDESICGWGDTGIPQFDYNQFDASHPMLRGFYYRLYAGIDYCNHYLDACGDYDAVMSAEVRFLRALNYYFLMDCWGNVPFAEHLSAECPQQIMRADLFAWLVSELEAVTPTLIAPRAVSDKEAGYGRVDQDAANLLLARMYLNAEVYTGTAQWQKAFDYAEKVINGPHKLHTTGVNGWSAYQMLFMGDNGSNGAHVEAILPVLQDGATTTSWGTSLFLMASTWKADMDTESNYGTSEYWAGNRARKQLILKFFADEASVPQATIANTAAAAGDDRALFFGIDRELTISNVGEFTSGYSVGKFRNTYSDGTAPHHSQFVDMDYFLMRSAEAYLIAAEADARLHGGQCSDKGIDYINQIRSRAHAGKKANVSVDEILDERSRELYYEGFRRTDLIRYNKFGGNVNYNWEWKAGQPNGANFEAFRNLFALPDEDMNANKNLVQNPGY